MASESEGLGGALPWLEAAPSRTARSASWRLTTLTCLAVLTAIYGAWLVWRMFLPLEINYNEAWNAWQAQAAMGAGPLYPPSDALITNNYPPLSFYLIGGLSQLFHADPILVGRMVCLASVVMIGAAASAIIRTLGGSPSAAAIGGVWLLATMARIFPRQVAMDEPTPLALAVMAWALAWLLDRRRKGELADGAILLMVAAGFIKHNLVAVPIAALAWLWTGPDRRLALRLTLVGGMAAAAGLAVCTVAYGGNFPSQLFLFRRASSLARVATQQGKILALIVAIAIGWAWSWPRRRQSDRARFVVLFIVAAAAVLLFERTGEGVDFNAAFELVLAASVGLGLGIGGLESGGFAARLGPARAHALVLAALLLPLLASSDGRPYLFLFSQGFRDRAAASVRSAEVETARIRAIPGKVYCTTTSVCFRAGKAFVYDPFAMHQRVRTGHWSAAALDRRLASAGIRQETVGPENLLR